jgi:hypothetical protein
MRKRVLIYTLAIVVIGCVVICTANNCAVMLKRKAMAEELKHYQVWEKQYMLDYPDYENLRILIDIDEKTLYLLDGNKLIKKYMVATGKPSTPTPIGRWKVISKARWGGGFGSRWIGLDVPWGKYGIHGTNRPSSIGYNASHGCIRMHNRDVEDLYNYVKYGTPVVIYGGVFGPFGNGARNLQPGDRGIDVVEVQRRLKMLGYYNGYIDGVYGPRMERAVNEFQKDKGLPVSRTIYYDTYKAMGILMVD